MLRVNYICIENRALLEREALRNLFKTGNNVPDLLASLVNAIRIHMLILINNKNKKQLNFGCSELDFHRSVFMSATYML